jgi:hypothetical protein
MSDRRPPHDSDGHHEAVGGALVVSKPRILLLGVVLRPTLAQTASGRSDPSQASERLSSPIIYRGGAGPAPPLFIGSEERGQAKHGH